MAIFWPLMKVSASDRSSWVIEWPDNGSVKEWIPNRIWLWLDWNKRSRSRVSRLLSLAEGQLLPGLSFIFVILASHCFEWRCNTSVIHRTYPEFIRFLFNPDSGMFAVQTCGMNDEGAKRLLIQKPDECVSIKNMDLVGWCIHHADGSPCICSRSKFVQPEQTCERGRVVRTPFCLRVRLFLSPPFSQR